jgi:hypothetical protein
MFAKRCIIAVSGSFVLSACTLTPEQRTALSNSLAAVAQGAQAVRAAPVKLMVFGGQGHQTYLGCLNCNEYASDSVQNAYGTFGSAYMPNSMANQYGEFGSPYSMYSACSQYASDPPVIVDDAGNFYGRLTVNAYNLQRTQDAGVIRWLTQTVCAH